MVLYKYYWAFSIFIKYLLTQNNGLFIQPSSFLERKNTVADTSLL